MSVLFADLVGFTPFAEERDAEDVRDTLTRYFDLASEVIGRYGGTVEKFIGDAVMAVWGAPVAHEDDAERGVRAGLELVDAVRTIDPGLAVNRVMGRPDAAFYENKTDAVRKLYVVVQALEPMTDQPFTLIFTDF